MEIVVLTGATSGIGAALALALSGPARTLVLSGRREERLAERVRAIAERGGHAVAVPGDLSTVRGARELGAAIGAAAPRIGTLVHCAGLWPSRRELTSDGVERAFAVNHLGPMAITEQLAPRLDLGGRVAFLSAGLLGLGRWSAEATPRGADFHSIRTYATTKLCSAMYARELARARPEVSVVAIHPGVVRTELGERGGVLGAVVRLVKRAWESPEQSAERTARVISSASAPRGEGLFVNKDAPIPWPAKVDDLEARASMMAVSRALLA